MSRNELHPPPYKRTGESTFLANSWKKGCVFTDFFLQNWTGDQKSRPSSYTGGVKSIHVYIQCNQGHGIEFYNHFFYDHLFLNNILKMMILAIFWRWSRTAKANRGINWIIISVSQLKTFTKEKRQMVLTIGHQKKELVFFTNFRSTHYGGHKCGGNRIHAISQKK